MEDKLSWVDFLIIFFVIAIYICFLYTYTQLDRTDLGDKITIPFVLSSVALFLFGVLKIIDLRKKLS